MPCYEMVGTAPHVEDGVMFEKGDVIESEENLEEKWAGKFVETHKKATDVTKKRKMQAQRRDPKSPVVNKQTPTPVDDPHEPEETDEEAGDETEEEHAEEETDVTDKYEAAAKKGLTVTKVGKTFTLKDADGEVVKEGLKRSEVAAAVKRFRK